MQCGIQETMSAFVRALQSGLLMAWRFVTTGVSCVGGGGGSTCTVSVEVAFVSPLSAVTRRTYAPGAERVAVVPAAFGSAKVTLPGPDTWLHTVDGCGPGLTGGAGASPLRPRPPRGGPPQPRPPLQDRLPSV